MFSSLSRHWLLKGFLLYVPPLLIKQLKNYQSTWIISTKRVRNCFGNSFFFFQIFKIGPSFYPAAQESQKSPMKLWLLLDIQSSMLTPPHEWLFGNYLADRQARIGGYLPVFWRSPHSVIHATGDIGQMISWISEQVELEAGEKGCLAVLHNRNDMSGALNSSVWVANSEGRVISRGVTSCAGLTAQHVLLAQTKIGFLTGGRGYSFQELSPEDKQSQLEEAFARATVALTRAQRFCFIMCPLDMKGIIGAATVVGCLQHGVGICDERSTGSSLLVELKAGSLAQSRDDSNFLEAFRLSATVKTSEFPPAALVELYHEPEASAARL